ncbi:uncharacterized protein [Dermacentor albipictus]|uniref:uncharacterized protein isoform X2 n=1 Tax=Dermacentor albipictus TaxID=60249 RepID=UPI0038FC97DA
MLLLAPVLLALNCAHMQQCGAFAGPARWHASPFMETQEPATRSGGQDASDDEVVATAEQATHLVRVRGREAAAGGKPVSAPGHRRLHRQWTAPNRRHDDDRKFDDGGPFYRRLFNRRQARNADVNSGPQRRFRPERHERCDDDLDCRVSPSQVCVKRAREPFGRCQCPFYRPVEITVDAVVRCVTAKDLFDECRATEECTAANPYLRCVNHLCVCASPHVLHDRDQCRPANDLRQWMSWLVPVVVVVGTLVTSVACFLSRRWRMAERVPPVTSQRASSHDTTADRPPNRSTVDDSFTARPNSPTRRPQLILRWLRVPPTVHRRMREWARFYEKGSQPPAGATASNYPATHPGPGLPAGGASLNHQCPTPIFWAKRAVRLLPSPLYQGKLLQNVVPGVSGGVATGAFLRKCAAGAGRLAGVATPHSRPLKASAVGAARVPANMPPVLPASAPIVLEGPVTSPPRRVERPQSPSRSSARSEGASSFLSFPTGESAAPAGAAAFMHDDFPQLRRSLAGGSVNGVDDVRSAGVSDDEPVLRSVRRVSFADY